MSRRERAIVHEGLALAFVSLFAAFAVPTLISARDSVVAVAGVMLLMVWLGWGGWYFFRLMELGGSKK